MAEETEELNPAAVESGIRLARAREQLGLTQQQFAEFCGVTRLTQNYYERGRRDPKLDYLRKCQDMSINLDWLGNGDAGEASHLFESGVLKTKLVSSALDHVQGQIKEHEAILESARELILSTQVQTKSEHDESRE